MSEIERLWRGKSIQMKIIIFMYEKFINPGKIDQLTQRVIITLMGEGFILLTRGYRFMGGWTTPLLTR